MTNDPARQRLMQSEEAQRLALLTCLAKPGEILDRSRALPEVLDGNLEATLKDLCKIADPKAWQTNNRR